MDRRGGGIQLGYIISEWIAPKLEAEQAKTNN